MNQCVIVWLGVRMEVGVSLRAARLLVCMKTETSRVRMRASYAWLVLSQTQRARETKRQRCAPLEVATNNIKVAQLRTPFSGGSALVFGRVSFKQPVFFRLTFN